MYKFFIFFIKMYLFHISYITANDLNVMVSNNSLKGYFIFLSKYFLVVFYWYILAKIFVNILKHANLMIILIYDMLQKAYVTIGYYSKIIQSNFFLVFFILSYLEKVAV